MSMNSPSGARTRGFTIIELVVVIVIIGILAATALPRFVDLTGDAHSANVEANGSSLQSGIMLTHAQWVARGASANVDSTTLEGGTVVGFTDSGWVQNDLATGGDGTATAAECIALWNAILQPAPAVATDTSGTFQASIRGGGRICRYTYTAVPGRRIDYDIRTGSVTTTVP